MNDAERAWFISQYDQVVADEADGIGFGKLRDALAHAYADAVESGEVKRPSLHLVEVGATLVDRYVRPERIRRRENMRRTAEFIRDAIRHPEDGATLLIDGDPVLDLAHGLGDGRDKVLRGWTIEDWRTATLVRYSNAAAATAAAKDFHDIADQIVAGMVARAAGTTGAAVTER